MKSFIKTKYALIVAALLITTGTLMIVNGPVREEIIHPKEDCDTTFTVNDTTIVIKDTTVSDTQYIETLDTTGTDTILIND